MVNTSLVSFSPTAGTRLPIFPFKTKGYSPFMDQKGDAQKPANREIWGPLWASWVSAQIGGLGTLLKIPRPFCLNGMRSTQFAYGTDHCHGSHLASGQIGDADFEKRHGSFGRQESNHASNSMAPVWCPLGPGLSRETDADSDP